MKWVKKFQIFLFDFDGLLVDTEPVHHAAFIECLKRNGCACDWDFAMYCKLAHSNATALWDAAYTTFPDLKEKAPNVQDLRAEKTKIYEELLHKTDLQLMPGVDKLLLLLDNLNVKRAVVTNSTESQTNIIRKKLPILDSIDLWVCREQYSKPKPDPEGYLSAIVKLSEPGEQIIGFEDSAKGLQALQETSAKPVLISKVAEFAPGVAYFPSFEAIPTNWKN